MAEQRTKKVAISVHVAVDSHGQWFAWGSGVQDSSDFRDEAIALFNVTVPWLNHADKIGCDEADVERFTIITEIPIPNHVIIADAVRPTQRELFSDAGVIPPE